MVDPILQRGIGNYQSSQPAPLFEYSDPANAHLGGLFHGTESSGLQGTEQLGVSEPQGPLLSQQIQHRIDQEHLERTAMQLEAQQRLLDQRQDFLDQQQRLLVAVQQNGPSVLSLQNTLHSQQTRMGQQSQQGQVLMQHLHQQQALIEQVHLPQSASMIPQNQHPQQGVGGPGALQEEMTNRLRTPESTSEQVATSEEGTPSLLSQPGQVFGSGTIKQIVYDSLCSGNENPVTFVNSQGGQITILNNANKGPSAGVPGTVVTIDGKRHFFPSDPVPSATDTSAPNQVPRQQGLREGQGLREEDEGLSHHSRDGSQSNAGPPAEGDALPALSCSLSEVQGGQQLRPETSHSHHGGGEQEQGNSLAEATSRVNVAAGLAAVQMEGGRGQQADGGRGRVYASAAAQQRHRSPSPVPSGHMMPASALLGTNQMQFGAPLGDSLAQGGHAPAFSDPNSEGANSWQGYSTDGKRGGLLNPSPFPGGYQDPNLPPSSQNNLRQPPQQNVPSRPSTPVAILSSDGTVTVSLNGFTSQAIPVIGPNSQSAQFLSRQPSNPGTLAQMFQMQPQQQSNQQFQQQTNVQTVQFTQVGGQSVQILQNLQAAPLQDGGQLASGPQYVQLSDGGTYQVASGQQGFAVVGQSAAAVGSGQMPGGAQGQMTAVMPGQMMGDGHGQLRELASGQQANFGGHGGAQGWSQMGQPGGLQEILYVQAQPAHLSPQTSSQEGDQRQLQGSFVYIDQRGNPAYAQQPNARQLAQIAPAAPGISPVYQQISTGPQSMPMLHSVQPLNQQLNQNQSQLSGSPQMLHSLQPNLSYQEAQQQYVVDQSQLVGMRPQATHQGNQPANGGLPPVQPRSESPFRSEDQQLMRGSLYQEAAAGLGASQILPAVQHANATPAQLGLLSRPASTHLLQQAVSMQPQLRQTISHGSFAAGAQSAPVPGYVQQEPTYQLLNQGDPSRLPHSNSFGGQHMLAHLQPVVNQHTVLSNQQSIPIPQAQGQGNAAAHQGARGDNATAGPQTTITTAFSQSESEEVQSRSGSSTQMLSQGPQETWKSAQVGGLALHQLRSGSPAVPGTVMLQPENSTHVHSTGTQPLRPPLAPAPTPGAFTFVPPTPSFHGTPNTVLPAIPRSLQPASMLRTVSSGVSAAGSLNEGGLSRVSSGHVSSGSNLGQRSGLGGRTGSVSRINYMHGEADALAAAAAVEANNGLELPDLALRQFHPDAPEARGGEDWSPDGAELDKSTVENERGRLPTVRLGRSRSGGVDVEAIFSPNTASKNAAQLVDTGHVSSAAAGDLGRTSVVLDPGARTNAGGGNNLQRTNSMPQQGGSGQASAFLGAFSKSHVTVAPPLVADSQAAPLHGSVSDPRSLPPLDKHLGEYDPSKPQEVQRPQEPHLGLMRGPVRRGVELRTSLVSPQTPQTGPLDEVVASPSVAAAQALSFLNDEPDPNFQPQGVEPDREPSLVAQGLEPTETATPGGEQPGSGTVQPSPNSPLASWEGVSTPEKGGQPVDDVRDSSERKRKRKEEGGAAETGPVGDVTGGAAAGAGGHADVGAGNADVSVDCATAGGVTKRLVAHHSREISLVDGLFLDAFVEEDGARKVRKVEGDHSEEAAGSQ